MQLVGSLFETVFRFLHALFELLDFSCESCSRNSASRSASSRVLFQSREFPLKEMYSLLPGFDIFLPVEIRSFYM